MKRIDLITKTIDRMSVKELKTLLDSRVDAIRPYKGYIELKIQEKQILNKYFKAA
jgi:hypothetical protein